MATAVQRKEGVGLWAETFPSQQTTFKESLMFMKRLLGVAVCNIAYLRMMFPNDAFVDKSLEGIHLKILKSSNDNPQVAHLINCLKGVFDALDKKYLKTLVFMIHPDPDDANKVLDSYTFQFSYQDGSNISVYSNNKKISSMNMADKTKEATLKMLRTLIISASTLEPLPSAYSLSMKLFYYDDVTPSDYEPPGFEPSEEGECKYNGTPMTIMIGSVSTVYHTVNLQLTTTVSKESETKDEDNDDVEMDLQVNNAEELNQTKDSLDAKQEESSQQTKVISTDDDVETQKHEDPLMPSHKNRVIKNPPEEVKSPRPKGSKRKLKNKETDLEESFCSEASKLNIEGCRPTKQSKSKHLHFEEDPLDSQNSQESFKINTRKPRTKKRLH